MTFLKVLILTLSFFGYYCSSAYAYLANYPPYELNAPLFKKIEVETLYDTHKGIFKFEDDKSLISLTTAGEEYEFIVRDGQTTLIHTRSGNLPTPFAVYRVDVDGNGLKDFIIFYNYYQWLYGVREDKVEIVLKKDNNTYHYISYDTITASLEDFVDLNRDGKNEIIMTGIYNGKELNYITYNVYNFKELKLVNVDDKFNDLLLSVWYEYAVSGGDKTANDFTDKEKMFYTEHKNNSIQYRNHTILDAVTASSTVMRLQDSKKIKAQDESRKTNIALVESQELAKSLEFRNRELTDTLVIKERKLKALEEKNQELESIIEGQSKFNKEGQTHPEMTLNNNMTFKIGVVDVQRVLDESKKGIEARNYIEGLYSLRSDDELIRTEQVLIEEIIKDVQNIIREYAKKGKYTYITEKTEGGVVFNEDQFDVTKEIINLYDKKVATSEEK